MQGIGQRPLPGTYLVALKHRIEDELSKPHSYVELFFRGRW